MLTKQEWVKKYVYKWKGLMNFDTKTYEGGYLFLWNEEHTVATGHSERNITSRSQAIAYHYDLYVKEQTKRPQCPVCGTTEHTIDDKGFVIPNPPKHKRTNYIGGAEM
jgi:hypothetical protein